MGQFLLGMIVMASLTIGLFFLRFWRKTLDRLFIIFAVAFWLLGLNWLMLAVFRESEAHPRFFLIRLLAFLLILLAIIDKNRAAGG